MRPKKIALRLALAMAAVFALAQNGSAQTTAPAAKPHHAGMKGMHKDEMKAECEVMKAKKKEIEEKLQAMDATMDRLIAEMNAAGATAKVDAMAKPMALALTELVGQRKATHAMKAKMEAEMMQHMMRHMHSGDAKGGMKDKSDCPMMKMDGHKGHDAEAK